ncbi:TRAP transporter small permease [Oscillibacter sp.]|uniref:TRAP transporter small permease n=1 Tax=Oscillibacter sp. TaxID=1945593 RepID=UPI002D80694B|nr:TRAP transporter small permease [Oscillibacter sp.]
MNETKKRNPLRILGNLDLYVAVVLLVCLLALTFAGVLKRYILRSPITWMEEMQGLLFMWITIIGGSAAFRNASHVSVEILVDSLPKKIGGIIERVDVLIQLVILSYLCSQEFAYYFQLTSTGKVTNLLRIPYSLAYLALPIGGVLMIVSMLWASYRHYVQGIDLKGGENE